MKNWVENYFINALRALMKFCDQFFIPNVIKKKTDNITHLDSAGVEI
jgi:hypothetical protein